MLLPCTKLNCTSLLAVPWIILRSNLRILKNIMQRDQQQLHLRGNIILYQGNGSIFHLWLKFTERLKFDCACVFSTHSCIKQALCVIFGQPHPKHNQCHGGSFQVCNQRWHKESTVRFFLYWCKSSSSRWVQPKKNLFSYPYNLVLWTPLARPTGVVGATTVPDDQALKD